MRQLILTVFLIVTCHTAIADGHGKRLTEVLANQTDEVKARYEYRHPQETLEFFGVEPGMTVVEALPGGGWYSKILVEYLGEDGHVIGVDYAMEMWPNFSFGTPEFIAERANWDKEFLADAAEWRGESGASAAAFRFGSMPDQVAGTADIALFVRALHNLARFESEGDYLTIALADVYASLKPGGILAVVQHAAREDMPDDWADGSNGYLKESFVTAKAEEAGFEFVAASGVNKNDKDQPGTEDFVWRLPPSYNTTGDDPERKAKVDAIGESNRMTLKFIKPE